MRRVFDRDATLARRVRNGGALRVIGVDSGGLRINQFMRFLGVCRKGVSECLAVARDAIRCQHIAMHIKIVRRPIGEAPDWVRDAWIGLSVPLVLEEERSWRTVGVLSGPRNFLLQIGALLMGKTEKVTGYLVNAKVAVDMLEATQPEAASWWRSEAPHVVTGSYHFIFDAPACERETEMTN